jgi:hypothetical protein
MAYSVNHLVFIRNRYSYRTRVFVLTFLTVMALLIGTGINALNYNHYRIWTIFLVKIKPRELIYNFGGRGGLSNPGNLHVHVNGCVLHPCTLFFNVPYKYISLYARQKTTRKRKIIFSFPVGSDPTSKKSLTHSKIYAFKLYTYK